MEKDKFIEKMERTIIFWAWVKIITGVLFILLLTLIINGLLK